MSNIVILFADKTSKYLMEKAFDGESAFDLSLRWARKQGCENVVVFATPENEGNLRAAETELIKNYGFMNEAELAVCDKFAVDFVVRSDWTIHNLMSEIKSACEKYNADFAVYAWADCPFLNASLTKEIIETHTEFVAEYTFAEGFPYGLSPEVIDSGAAGILAALSETTQKECGDKLVTRTSIFDLLKTDINSFEIETVLSDEDWRLFRFNFDAGNKSNFIACKSLYESCENIFEMSAEKISEIASTKKEIIKTVPSFYNVQITDWITGHPIYLPSQFHSKEMRGMFDAEQIDIEKFNKLIDDIAEFSENAVIDISYMGDPFASGNLPAIVSKILSYSGLSVFIETDGYYVTEGLVSELEVVARSAAPRTNGYEKIMFAVALDALTDGTFEKIRGISKSEFQKVVGTVSILAKYFPQSVYPQFTRVNENESELEGFYRFWNEKTNPSNGNLIIQKYNSFCGTLPDGKPADLSPLERNVCWHLRRDVSILINGEVNFCHCRPDEKIGNAFSEPLEEIWARTDGETQNQIENLCKKNKDIKLCEKCGKCDEYYTFNF